MSGALLSIVSGWWNRLFRRGRPRALLSEALATNAEGAKPAANETADVEASVARAGVAEVPVAETAQAEAAQSLRDTLGVDALPGATAAMRAQRQSRERTLEALGDLRQIPALQSLAQGFTQAMNRVEVSIDEVISTISKDSALCVRVLRMANSVLVSPERRIEDLESAVHMLGVARVRNAAQALFTLRDAKRVAEGFDWRHLWIHALATAAFAEELERQLRSADDSQIHLAALLHDVGKIVLSTVAPDHYRDVLVTSWQRGGRLEELERERLGVDHREAGVLFATHNRMPEIVVQAIAHHAQPEKAEQHRFEVALVAIANFLSKSHGLGFSGAQLEAADGDFETLPAWDVVAETCGYRPDCARLEEELRPFVAELRQEMRGLREAG